MKVLIVLCLVAGAFSRNCPRNSHYNDCGTACPRTCDNYQDPPVACVLMCNPGCHCDEGYVKTYLEDCVKPEQCPDVEGEAGTSCLGGADPGMCLAAFPMFYYDVPSGTCKEFLYGGCGGSGNRYPSEEACLKKCGA